MGRKSALTPQQWAAIDERLLRGESPSSIAKDYRGITRQAIANHAAKKVNVVKDVANQIVSAERNLHKLPFAQQVQAQSLAQRLMRVAENVTSGSDYLAGNFMRLGLLASTELSKVDDVEPTKGKSFDRLQAAASLTKMANDAVEAPLRFLALMKVSEQANGTDDGALEIRGGLPD